MQFLDAYLLILIILNKEESINHEKHNQFKSQTTILISSLKRDNQSKQSKSSEILKACSFSRVVLFSEVLGFFRGYASFGR